MLPSTLKFSSLSLLGALLLGTLFSAPLSAFDLFNGQNLDGWYSWVRGHGKNVDPNGVFSVHDGMIHVTGQDFGCLTTEKEYSNYRLTVEFKWGEKTWGSRENKAMDSGILIHSFGPDGAFGGIWMHSVEANVCEGGMGDFWIVGSANDGIAGTCRVSKRGASLVFDPKNGTPSTITANGAGCFRWSGSPGDWKDELHFRGPNDFDRPNDWNAMTVVARGNVMTVYLNGKLVNEVYDLRQTSGKIQLQSEGAEIFFRKVKLEPLAE